LKKNNLFKLKQLEKLECQVKCLVTQAYKQIFKSRKHKKIILLIKMIFQIHKIKNHYLNN
jgi:hypothetical protein